MADIERHVRFDAPPIQVAAALARSPWRAAMAIEPAGAGCRVVISASIEPAGLAHEIEARALDDVCRIRSGLVADPDPDATPVPIAPAPFTPPLPQSRRFTMTALDLTIAIDAPPEQVWAALADFGGIARWNPNVKTSALTSSADTGAGVSRECNLTPMGTVQETSHRMGREPAHDDRDLRVQEHAGYALGRSHH